MMIKMFSRDKFDEPKCERLSDLIEAELQVLFGEMIPEPDLPDYVIEHGREIRQHYCTYECDNRFMCMVNPYKPKEEK